MSDDDYGIEDITPSDLGCLGEPEIDAGVVEETQQAAKPSRLSFEQIPFAKKKAFKKLYDSFTVKDLSFADFCIQLYAIQSPGLMQQDLGSIMAQKHAGYQRKAAIDHTVNKMS